MTDREIEIQTLKYKIYSMTHRQDKLMVKVDQLRACLNAIMDIRETMEKLDAELDSIGD